MDEIVRDVPIHGHCASEFAAVRDAFTENFHRRGQIGAAVCVYKDGRKIVDLWGSHKDLARKEPWAEDTIVIQNSLAKSMCAISMHILIDRGEVDFDGRG
jgi:CubicO group peptidase (beta-lactamase class C family)